MRTDKYVCDLCHKEIPNYSPDGNGMIFFGTNQRWPVGDKIYDVCRSCCDILNHARQCGMIEIDNSIFYIQAGLKHEGDFWVR